MICVECKNEIRDPKLAWVRVTGWGRGTKTGVKELFDVSAPHAYMCGDCGWAKQHGVSAQPESLF